MSFDDCQKVEAESLRILMPLLRKQSLNGQFVMVNKGRLAKEIQATAGDVLMNKDGGTFQTVEIKSEAEDKYGRLFLETWSNRRWWRPGWFFTIQSDWLLYHFVSDWTLYAVPLDDLRAWAFQQFEYPRNGWRVTEFREREQQKSKQLNDTWGWTVDIGILRREIPSFKAIDLKAVVSDNDYRETA